MTRILIFLHELNIKLSNTNVFSQYTNPNISSGIFFNTFFTGMEIASYLIDKAASITVIGSSEMPYQNTLGPEIGRVTMMVRHRNGISNFTGRVLDFVASADAGWEKCEILHERQRDGGQRAGRKGEGSGT